MSSCVAAFGFQPSLLQCLRGLMCVGCQRAPGLPGWGLLGLVQRGFRAPSQVGLFRGSRSSQSLENRSLLGWPHALSDGCHSRSSHRNSEAPPLLLPGATVQFMGPSSFSQKTTTWGRTRIPGQPQIMADRIKGHIGVTFQGACLLRERAKWKRSECF